MLRFQSKIIFYATFFSHSTPRWTLRNLQPHSTVSYSATILLAIYEQLVHLIRYFLHPHLLEPQAIKIFLSCRPFPENVISHYDVFPSPMLQYTGLKLLYSELCCSMSSFYRCLCHRPVNYARQLPLHVYDLCSFHMHLYTQAEIELIAR